jgi:hypothetical protein
MKDAVNGEQKLTPSVRREQVALGVKAGKLRHLMASELGVTAATIGRDLKILGIKEDKKQVGKSRHHWRARWLAANPPTDENLQHEELREDVLIQGRIRVRLI